METIKAFRVERKAESNHMHSRVTWEAAKNGRIHKREKREREGNDELEMEERRWSHDK